MIPPEVTHIFFDLDRTLWDFERNSRDTLSELLSEIHDPDITAEFIGAYRQYNYLFWGWYQSGKVPQSVLRVRRFEAALHHLGLPVQHAHTLAEEYVRRCPDKKGLFPGALDVLQHLQSRYTLYLVTNGFMDVQQRKITASGIAPLIHGMITSDDAGSKKPHPRIFSFAMEQSGVTEPGKCLFIGDDLHADMHGARYMGMHTLHFTQDPQGEWDPQICDLKQLLVF